MSENPHLHLGGMQRSHIVIRLKLKAPKTGIAPLLEFMPPRSFSHPCLLTFSWHLSCQAQKANAHTCTQRQSVISATYTCTLNIEHLHIQRYVTQYIQLPAFFLHVFNLQNYFLLWDLEIAGGRLVSGKHKWWCKVVRWKKSFLTLIRFNCRGDRLDLLIRGNHIIFTPFFFLFQHIYTFLVIQNISFFPHFIFLLLMLNVFKYPISKLDTFVIAHCWRQSSVLARAFKVQDRIITGNWFNIRLEYLIAHVVITIIFWSWAKYSGLWVTGKWHCSFTTQLF